MENVVLKIASNKQVGKDVFEMILEGDLSSVKNPGEFVEIKLDGYYLRRPISVCEFNKDSLKKINICTNIYQSSSTPLASTK